MKENISCVAYFRQCVVSLHQFMKILDGYIDA